MDKPTITINGEVKVMPPVKARAWRELMQCEEEFKELRKDFKSDDAIEKHCEIIAKLFGVTADEVLDNLDIDDVLPTYFRALGYVVAMLTDKLSGDKKNAVETAET